VSSTPASASVLSKIALSRVGPLVLPFLLAFDDYGLGGRSFSFDDDDYLANALHTRLCTICPKCRK
jgi:hypothetical protein